MMTLEQLLDAGERHVRAVFAKGEKLHGAVIGHRAHDDAPVMIPMRYSNEIEKQAYLAAASAALKGTGCDRYVTFQEAYMAMIDHENPAAVAQAAAVGGQASRMPDHFDVIMIVACDAQRSVFRPLRIDYDWKRKPRGLTQIDPAAGQKDGPLEMTGRFLELLHD